MTTPTFRRCLIAVTLGALLGSTAVVDNSAWAADSTKASVASHEDSALGHIGRARYAAQSHRPQDLVKRIDDAELSLLNIAQVDRDPHVLAALQHLDRAKDLTRNNDLGGAEAELAAATAATMASLAAADASQAASDAVPPIGAVVYDASSAKLGEVTEVIFNQQGTVDLVIVDVGPSLGTGLKNVAVPRSNVTEVSDHVKVDRSKEDLQKAAAYQLPNYKL
jgi:hypothetical protein